MTYPLSGPRVLRESYAFADPSKFLFVFAPSTD